MADHSYPFHFVGNDLVLDFINTRVADGPTIIDLIETLSQFGDWLGRAQLDCSIGDWTGDDFAALHDLREALQQVFRAVIEGCAHNSSALQQINSHLRGYAKQVQISHDGQAFTLEENETAMSPQAFMALLANQAAHLLTSTDPSRIKNCAQPECVLLYKDTSKSGKRRWCDMETCGNRAKAARFRASAVLRR